MKFFYYHSGAMVCYSIYHTILETEIPEIIVIALKMEPSKDAQISTQIRLLLRSSQI